MKIGIIGAGNVGSAAAYSIVLQGIADEIVMIDYNKEKAIAEAEDILHATSMYEYNTIHAGDYEDLQGADIVVITAGTSRKIGQSRNELLADNVKIFKSIVPNISQYAPDSIIIVASNPVDVMAHITLEISRFSPNKVISTGTTLDSSRFRAEIGKHLNLPAKSIDAYTLGEHGDSQVVIWSNAKIFDTPILKYAKEKGKEFTPDIITQINDNVVRAGYNIIKGKGSTFYGIGSCIARICKAIKKNENVILMVASLQKDVCGVNNVFVSLPTIVNKHGIKEVVMPKISNEEKELLEKSAKAVLENTQIALSSI